MNMDRNTVIGMILLAGLFFMFFWYTNKQQSALSADKQRIADSTAKAEAAKITPEQKAAAYKDSLNRDSVSKLSAAGNFQGAAIGAEQLTTVENELMKVVFTNKGGSLKSVELKKYNSLDSTHKVILAGGKDDKLGYSINTAGNQSEETSSLFFTNAQVTKNADGSQTIVYTLGDSAGKSITHQYIVKRNNYMIDWNIILNGADKLLTQNSLNLHWNVQVHQQQVSHAYEVQQSNISFYDEDGYDYTTAASGANNTFDKPVEWFGFKQQFFNTTIVSKNKFASGTAQMVIQPDTLRELYNSTAAVKIQVPAASTATIPLQLYYGPNEYKTLQQYGNGMENIVNLGSGIFSFVKYINRWIIMPVFNFFANLIGHYGWVIALLTLFIRLVTSPLTYRSYLSGAKMRVLRPEIDALKKKFPDQQTFGMEQMKLFREAGVNPLGGCMPALLQIPIFFSLYSFFSSNIDLRGQGFLWIKDISAYDVMVKLPFSGDTFNHISLFTLTAVATSFLISIYNMAMTPQQDNPAMKYMPYIFPFILLFVFNRLPSALTWYYTVSNLITLGIQFVIQNYIIDHDKILTQMQEKRKTPKTKSKFQERFEQMQESQKKLQDMKNKNQGKK
ncbi:membrane protein insertase YidC [Panacibacter ginsenosidivorans]|uniref:Membrane protein insertase YidC n=2 Tax=Panacibacter ginsenosidivorans TaxID=1813871 RepID=A0A5B8VCL1_9BACT|nr:membrane protein insertase YidC [Panacibacter ginsenosidivorans]